jgi:hypothetical protein
MGRSQPQYVIRANRNCKTHPFGCEIVYTGPRTGCPKGWTVVKPVDTTVPTGHGGCV